MNGRQAAQRFLALQLSMPIDHECAKHPNFPEMAEMNRACDAWLRKRGLIYETWNRTQLKPDNSENTTNDQEFTL